MLSRCFPRKVISFLVEWDPTALLQATNENECLQLHYAAEKKHSKISICIIIWKNSLLSKKERNKYAIQNR